MAEHKGEGQQEVDLFDLSRRIQLSESIRRCAEDEYLPVHRRGDRESGAQPVEPVPAKRMVAQKSASDESKKAQRPAHPTSTDNSSQARQKITSVPPIRPVIPDGKTALIGKIPAVREGSTGKEQRRERTAIQKKRANYGKIIKTSLIVALCCVIIGLLMVNRALGRLRYEPVDTCWSDVRAKEAPDWTVRGESDVTNILLLGIDGDGGARQRSDTILLLTLDGKNGVIKMTSILRDTYVFVPGRENRTRINHAYAYGGAALTLQTVESNFRVGVKRYLGVDMDGLTVAVDGLGGVEMTLTEAEAKVINKHVKGSSLTEGTHLLTGAQATYYARIRKIDSDFGRTGRQRKLLRAMLARFRRLNPIAQYNLICDVAPYLTTNLTREELLSAAMEAAGMMGTDMQEMTVPVQGGYKAKTIDKMAVLVPDLERNCRQLHIFLYGDAPE